MTRIYIKRLSPSKSQDSCTLSGKGASSRTRDKVDQGKGVRVPAQIRLLNRLVPALKSGGPKIFSPQPHNYTEMKPTTDQNNMIYQVGLEGFMQ